MFGFDFMFGFMSILFPIMFLLVFGIILFNIFRGIKEWNNNNHSPRLTVDAAVVGRRQHRSGGRNTSAHTSYYITFQVDSGDRMELHVPYNQFGYIIEGDQGKLTFQGTRFISFERQ